MTEASCRHGISKLLVLDVGLGRWLKKRPHHRWPVLFYAASDRIWKMDGVGMGTLHECGEMGCELDGERGDPPEGSVPAQL